MHIISECEDPFHCSIFLHDRKLLLGWFLDSMSVKKSLNDKQASYIFKSQAACVYTCHLSSRCWRKQDTVEFKLLSVLPHYIKVNYLVLSRHRRKQRHGGDAAVGWNRWKGCWVVNIWLRTTKTWGVRSSRKSKCCCFVYLCKLPYRIRNDEQRERMDLSK